MDGSVPEITVSENGSLLENILYTKIGGITVGRILGVAVLALVCLMVIKLLMKLVTRSLARTRLDEGVQRIVASVIRVVLLFIMVLILMDSLDISITSLVATLSVVGLAISLAIQNFLSNVAGGIQLLSTKPFGVGDYIEAGSTGGTVDEVGLFYVKMHTPDNKVIQIPNSQVVSDKIINYSAQSARRVEFNVTASYDAPVEQVKAALYRVIEGHKKVQTDPPPQARVSNYGSSAIEYVVRAWCPTEDYWDVYYDLMEGVKVEFDAQGIEMTYDHLNVHMIPPAAQQGNKS